MRLQFNWRNNLRFVIILKMPLTGIKTNNFNKILCVPWLNFDFDRKVFMLLLSGKYCPLIAIGIRNCDGCRLYVTNRLLRAVLTAPKRGFTSVLVWCGFHVVWGEGELPCCVRTVCVKIKEDITRPADCKLMRWSLVDNLLH